MITDKERVKEKISRAGLKATTQRIVLLEAISRMDFHPTADQIYESIHRDHPGISPGTVYKTVETFVSKGLLVRVFTEDGLKRYDPNLRHHGHIYCSNTKEIADYYNEELNELITAFFRKRRVSNLKIRNITLLINGEKVDPDREITIK